jgi:predicted nuclease of predicted toxin-antitoxin system
MNLTFLVDMNLSPAWVERFAREGWTAVHWSEVGDARATDSTVMEHARTHGQVVFTHDWISARFSPIQEPTARA